MVDPIFKFYDGLKRPWRCLALIMFLIAPMVVSMIIGTTIIAENPDSIEGIFFLTIPIIYGLSWIGPRHLYLKKIKKLDKQSFEKEEHIVRLIK